MRNEEESWPFIADRRMADIFVSRAIRFDSVAVKFRFNLIIDRRRFSFQLVCPENRDGLDVKFSGNEKHDSMIIKLGAFSDVTRVTKQN
jgi:hypothetical protein